MGNLSIKFKGITRRWYINIFGVIIVFLIGFEIVFSIIVYNYYYESVRQYLETRANVTAQFFNKYSKTQYKEFFEGTRKLADDFSEKDKIEMQIVNIDGNVLSSTNSYVPAKRVTTSDFSKAVWGETGSYNGRDTETHENIMAVSVGLRDASGNVRAVARFVVSLSEVDNFLLLAIIISVAVCIVILFLVLLSGRFYINSIVRPVEVITETARHIAKGEMTARIENRYDDEIGVLVDSINNMAEELSETEHLKNDFISSVSHELRTPLTAIKGWSETMLATDKSDEATIQRGLTVINEEAERLTRMVEELLDFSRMQNNRLIINAEEIDVGEALIESVYIMKERARREGFIIEFSVNSELPVIEGDKNRLKQVFINIIDNAIKHSEKAGKIIISAEGGENITIVFQDFGCGIPAEFMPKIKEKFIKGLSSKRGSGLGLALADEIIKLHGGTLDIESEEGKGTCVKIVLPVNKKNDGDAE